MVWHDSWTVMFVVMVGLFVFMAVIAWISDRW